ncbi:MAG: zeta toxin family protein [Candidatus Thiodiazotropha sp. (ex Lucina pensylvanica)]|nr:zeta toxin family protein [Candidatus Thiodiazotropha sp. (ex Lucina pensylvanica)]MBV2097140.1 zeta toxin family protein [Candidatus Thiodiazotropha sp. (ex Codakia orbicularis)]
MAKTQVFDQSDNIRTPFLRGILTRSLTDAGLAFETAYRLSSDIREQINSVDEITTDELRRLVTSELKKLDEKEVLENYEAVNPAVTKIMVRDRKTNLTPFSNIQHRRSLESSGLGTDKAAYITQNVYIELAESHQDAVDSKEVGRLTYEKLRQHYGKEAAKRYLVWVDYTHTQRPLILLIGGTTGCGKSTIATEVAHRLNIIRTQSTDMLREVMRMMVPVKLLPELHTSSFNAWRKIPGSSESKEPPEERMIHGYIHQAELVSVPCEAVIQRALNERVSLILEGVHVSPVLVKRFREEKNAVIVPIMLAVLKQDRLKHQLKDRGVTAPERNAQSDYLSNFESIWMLQSHLLSEADNNAIPIVANDDRDKTTDRVMRSIIEVLQKSFHAKVEDVFGTD